MVMVRKTAGLGFTEVKLERLRAFWAEVDEQLAGEVLVGNEEFRKMCEERNERIRSRRKRERLAALVNAQFRKGRAR